MNKHLTRERQYDDSPLQELGRSWLMILGVSFVLLSGVLAAGSLFFGWLDLAIRSAIPLFVVGTGLGGWGALYAGRWRNRLTILLTLLVLSIVGSGVYLLQSLRGPWMLGAL